MSQSRGMRRLLWVAVILLVLAASAVFGLDAAGRALIVEDPLHSADAILVLGGETREGDRVAHAVQLYKRGLAPLLVVSGTPVGFRTHEAEVMQRHAEFLGVPAARILAVKHNADSTREEAAIVVPVLRGRGLKEVILVTSNYHTARAKRIFTKAAGPSGPSFLASPVHEDSFEPDGWWKKRRHAKTFVFEAIKTVWSAIED
ncbi:MAG: YdcF family protein [Nitrospirae bacterium]|nr:MAG: YdcF family protein [Nitrospirota bacterium]